MSVNPAPGYGSFGFCEDSPYVACSLVNVQPNCRLTETPHLPNVAGVVLCAVSIIVLIILKFRIARKDAAVGGREMNLFYTWWIIALVFQILARSGFLSDKSLVKTFASIQVGLTTATAICLLTNAIFAWQLLPDGTLLSTLITITPAFIFGAVTSFLGASAGFNLNGAYDPTTGFGIAFFTFAFVIPAAAAFLYLVAIVILVVRQLRVRKPLLDLLATTLFFIIAQVIMIWLSPVMCDNTKGDIDGEWLAILFMTAGGWMLFRFWDAITEDEWDGFGV